MRGVGNFRPGNNSNGGISPSSSRLKPQVSFSSGLPSSLAMLPQISEIGSECIQASSPNDRELANNNSDARFYNRGFPYGSWNDSAFSGMKKDRDNDGKLYSGSNSYGIRVAFYNNCCILNYYHFYICAIAFSTLILAIVYSSE